MPHFYDVPHSELQEPNVSFLPTDAKPSVCYIVTIKSSMYALSTAFSNVTDSTSSPRSPVNPVPVKQEAMSISNALPHIQLKAGISNSDSLLEGMFYSVSGVNVSCCAYHEAVMKKNPHLVTGIRRFEDSNTPCIGLGGIDGLTFPGLSQAQMCLHESPDMLLYLRAFETSVPLSAWLTWVQQCLQLVDLLFLRSTTQLAQCYSVRHSQFALLSDLAQVEFDHGFCSIIWNFDYQYVSCTIDGSYACVLLLKVSFLAGKPRSISSESKTIGPVGIPEEGNGVVECVRDLKRFMTDRQQLLWVINDERRAHHHAKHNALVKNQSFQPGDVILCYRQVQRKTSDRISAKLTYGFTGPLIMLSDTGSTLYRIQKIRRALNQETRLDSQERNFKVA
jgi:hypothetical protein